MAEVRTLVDPRNPHDLQEAHRLQDAIAIEQERQGWFQVPAWDRTSQRMVRNALVALGRTVHDSRGMFGSRAQVDPIRHLIGTAMHWGGNPEAEATYLIVTPRMNDGTTVHRSRQMCPSTGSGRSRPTQTLLEPAARHAYSVNSLTATRSMTALSPYSSAAVTASPQLPLDHAGVELPVRLYSPRAGSSTEAGIFPTGHAVVPTSARARFATTTSDREENRGGQYVRVGIPARRLGEQDAHVNIESVSSQARRS
jgi:hypothetical protein